MAISRMTTTLVFTMLVVAVLTASVPETSKKVDKSVPSSSTSSSTAKPDEKATITGEGDPCVDTESSDMTGKSVAGENVKSEEKGTKTDVSKEEGSRKNLKDCQTGLTCLQGVCVRIF